jgi:hypothetical protein
LQAIETIKMIAKPKFKHHQDEDDKCDREHKRREKALDEALQNTFPASDPVSVEQPVLPAAAGNVDRESENPSIADGEWPDLAVEYVSERRRLGLRA